MKKSFSFCLSVLIGMLFFYSITRNVKAQEFNYPIVEIGGKPYLKYTVEKGEGLYGISKKFRISQSDIIDLNPEVKNGLRLGQVILIPTSITNQTESQGPQNSTIGEEVDQEGDSIYVVTKKETLYSISKKFKVTPADLIYANPDVKKVLSAGTTIRIPLSAIQSTEKKSKKELKEVSFISSQNKDKDDEEDLVVRKRNHVDMALLLPFSQDVDGRFVEFYEGMLLAIEDVKKKGLSVSLSVHDIGKDDKKIDSLLNTTELKRTELIIGPVYYNQIKKVAKFSFEKQRLMVLPFSLREKNAPINPYLFQVTPPDSILSIQITKEICERYKDYNILFLEDSIRKEQEDWCTRSLKINLEMRNIPYDTVIINPKEDWNYKLLFALKEDKENLIVPCPIGKEFLFTHIKELSLFKTMNPNSKITLLGSPEWQMYVREYMDDYYKLNTIIPTPHLIDLTKDGFKDFRKRFIMTYSRNIGSTYPRYAVFGYDLALYFIEGTIKWRNRLVSKAETMRTEGLQSDFVFERLDKWSMNVNQNLFFAIYGRDFQFSKIYLKK